MIPGWRVSRRETYPSHSLRGPLRTAVTGGARTHTRERERARAAERREERTRAATAASATAWWCGDQGGCTGCLDDHRVMSLGAWRPAAAADDDPEIAFPAGGSRPAIAPLLAASPLRPNSPREFASSSCIARSSASSWRAPYGLRRLSVDGDDEFRSTFGRASLFLYSHSTVRHARVRRADLREFASQISRPGGSRRSGTYTHTTHEDAFTSK